MVASRRGVLRTAGALAIGAAVPGLAPRLAMAQTFTATSISVAAQRARADVGGLGRRADNLLRQTVADGVERGGAAVRRFRAEQAVLARDLAAIFNSRVSEDDWLLIVPTRELDLVLTMRPLVIRIAPTAAAVEAALQEPLPQAEPRPGDTAADAVLRIALAALGVKTGGAVLTARLMDDGALSAALKAAAGAATAKRYGLAALELERLMRVLLLPRNVAAIADHAGAGSTRTIYQALVVRFVPFIGWTLFVALLLAAIYQHRDAAGSVLR